MGPLAERSMLKHLGEAVDVKPKQKDLREKLLRRKPVNCRADKTKLWKEKEGDTEMLIAKMRSEDIISLKKETSKLMLRLKENQNQYNILQDDSTKEERGRKEGLKEEDGRVPLKKSRNFLEGSGCSLEEYFKTRKGQKVAEGETAKQDNQERCEQDTGVKKQKKDIKVENVEKTKNKHSGKRTRKLERRMKDYLRLKEEKVIKKIEKELVEEILSEKGWEEKPDPNEDKKAFKKFKKLWKRKVDEKLSESTRRTGVGAKKIGDINHNVVESGSEEELVQVKDWDMKEGSFEAEDGKVSEGDFEDATVSGEGCLKENYVAEGFDKMSAEVVAFTEEVVSEDGSTEEEEGGLDISEDLKVEEEDPGYIQWKLTYLKSKLMELEEKEVLGTPTPENCDERGSPETRLGEGRVWICEESADNSKDGAADMELEDGEIGACSEIKDEERVLSMSLPSEARVWICEEGTDDSKDGQIEKGDIREAGDKGPSSGVEGMEIEEGEVIEAEAFVGSRDKERVFNCSISLPSGFLEAVVKACTKKPAGRRVLKLVKKKMPGVEKGCMEALEKKAVLEGVRSSEPDPSALEHLDLRPPESSFPPFTLMMHQQVVSALTNCGFKKRSSEGFDITRHDLCSLTGLRWLNDQVIQVYLSLVVERSNCATFKEQHMPKVLAMSTFIYQNIMRKSRGHAAVASWTNNLNLFENDLVLFPMHIDLSHWVLAVADFRSKTITTYDSMGNTHEASLVAILAYLDSEHKSTKGSKLKGFWVCQAADCPQQENTADCGVFLCRIAESLTREAGSGTFTQADMPYLRRRCLFEIVRGKLL